MKAALYIRVSTEDQAKEGHSLEVQAERLQAFCLAQGWEATKVYSDDSSGVDTDRPDYRAMLRDRNGWDVAVAIKGDRFHRSTDNAIAFWREMRAAGKQIWTIAEGRLDTPENASQWLGTMLTTAILPEFESKQLSERVLPAMEKAKDKALHVGRPPVGFIWVKELGRFQPTEWGTKIHDDAGQYGVVEAARRNRWPPADGAGKRTRGRPGRPISRQTVWQVLRNFELWESGRLQPNRQRTAPGTFSKFRE